MAYFDVSGAVGKIKFPITTVYQPQNGYNLPTVFTPCATYN